MGMPHRLASPALSENGIDISSLLVSGGLDRRKAKSLSKSGSPVEITGNHAALSSNTSSDDEEEIFIAAQQTASNRKASNLKGTGSKKSGGFQSLGLNSNLLKNITRKGFSVPTPIQRKTIPLILDNHDVVGMARTGSGKTAAFVIPMLEKLKAHSVQVGARAIIMSPSRELALQTLKVVKEFGKGSDLRSILLVGGDSLEDQFGQMSSNPDIVIATPGRFLHLLVEMSLDLSSIKYVVFDEADRLFEMGFASQLAEILHSLPPMRQTLLFSATLPKSLVEFAKAGLREPSLVRLDAETKVSPDLESAFLHVKSAEKEAALLHVLTDMIKMPLAPSSEDIDEQTGSRQDKKRKRDSPKSSTTDPPTAYSTIVFAATKHHVEYLTTLLSVAGFAVSHVYGSLDQTARLQQVEKFRLGRTTILVVTDVAARGIDIPMLANVINYDFPSQPKIFVHRVGRTARAGGKGWSYSLVQTSDLPYLLDLQLFLTRRLVIGRNSGESASFAEDVIVGSVPTTKMEVSIETVTKILERDSDIFALKIVAAKGEKLYTRTRNSASAESAKRAKTLSNKYELQEACLLYEEEQVDSNEIERERMLAKISGFRPSETVFEIGKRGEAGKTEAAIAAEKMRKQRQNLARKRNAEDVLVDDGVDRAPEQSNTRIGDRHDSSDEPSQEYMDTSEDEVEVTFKAQQDSNKAESLTWQDDEHFMSYEPNDANQAEERGYGVHSGSNQSANSNFVTAARGVTMDFDMDESKSFALPSRPNQMRWDKQSKKYVSRANDEDGSKGAKKIRGESGQKIAASFRSGRFDAWRKANKLDRLPRTGEQERPNSSQHKTGLAGRRYKHHAERAPKQPDKYRDDYFKKKKKLEGAKVASTSSIEAGAGSGGGAVRGSSKRNELKGAEEIRKQRRLKERRREKNARPTRRKG